MLSEDFDKKIKDAADQHHPAYDEKAWRSMEKLLNQHLPQQKDDRRRILLLLLLLFLIGGGAYMILSKGTGNKSASAEIAQENKTQAQSAPAEKATDNNIPSSKTTVDKVHSEVANNKTIPLKQVSKKVTENSSTTGSFAEKTTSQTKIINKVQPRNNVTENKNNVSSTNNDKQDKNTLNKEEAQSKSVQKITADNHTEQKNINLNSTVQKDNEIKGTTDPVANNPVPPNKNEEVSKTDTKKQSQSKKRSLNKNGFGVFVSAGPDVSKAGDSKAGKTTLLYGGGISYTMNRFTLKTGVFASKKIYWAGYNDYTIAFSTTPPTKFIGANADCDIIDIPVKLNYAFNVGNKSNWFAGAGLSSYLMKKEAYVFTYKSASTTYYYPYQTRNESKHYFSILNLSAGYTRKINKTISITAEPYVEIPLTGIGIGRVPLNSGGILFSIGVGPFKK